MIDNAAVKPTLSDVVDKLETLGSSRQIADFLEQQGILGVRGNAYSCAVAQYVERETGIMVGVNIIRIAPVTAVSDDEMVSLLGSPLSDFIAHFDAGNYPELVEV